MYEEGRLMRVECGDEVWEVGEDRDVVEVGTRESDRHVGGGEVEEVR